MGAIERIERSYSLPGFVAPMHQHQDEEILTCIRSGTVLHLDSMGHDEKLKAGEMRLINAGATLHHEERILDRDPVEGFHFHFRPERGGLEPMVQFLEASAKAVNEWRLIASRSEAPLKLRAMASAHEARLSIGSHHLPKTEPGIIRVLTIFEGRLLAGGGHFRKGDVLLLDDEEKLLRVVEPADLLLISTPKGEGAD